MYPFPGQNVPNFRSKCTHRKNGGQKRENRRDEKNKLSLIMSHQSHVRGAILNSKGNSLMDNDHDFRGGFDFFFKTGQYFSYINSIYVFPLLNFNDLNFTYFSCFIRYIHIHFYTNISSYMPIPNVSY